MHEMDLIPASYKAHRRLRRRQRFWASALGGLLLVAVGARLWIERGLAQERSLKAQWQPLQDKAKIQRTALSELNTLIAQARTPPASSPLSAPELPLAHVPSLLAALPTTGLRLSEALLNAAPETGADLHLRGQVADEATMARTVAQLQEHPGVVRVQLLGVKPEGVGGTGTQHFDLRVRLATSVASAAAGEKP